MSARGPTLALVLLVTGCGGGEEAAAPPAEVAQGLSPITGTVSYRERIALRPTAQLEVRLLDVTAADAPATTLGVARIDDPGLPPIDFRLDFNPANIADRNSYVLRAEIRDGERLLFTTERAYPVLTRGVGNAVDLMLAAVDHTPPADAPLLDTHWRLIAIDNQPVANKPPPDDAHLVLSPEGGEASGNAGCNRFTATFELEGELIGFGPVATTRMNCIDTMELENRFLAALAAVDRCEVVERELRLYAGARPVLTFVAIE